MKILTKELVVSFLLFFFCHGVVNGQQSRFDSLQNSLKTATEDTVRIRLLVQLTEECDEHEIPKYAGEAVELADKFFSSNTGNSKIRFAISHLKAIALNNLGYIYDKLGDIKKALDYNERSLKLREEIGDKSGMANSLNNIGVIYKTQGDLVKAVEYYNRSLKVVEAIGEKSGIATALNNIGTTYFSERKYEEAGEYYNRSLKIWQELNNQNAISLLFNNFGTIHLNKNDLPKALEYYLKSLEIREKAGDKQGIAQSLNNMGIVYLKQKKYDLAFLCTDSSLTISKRLGFPKNIRNGELILSRVDSSLGHFTSAFEHYKQYIIYRDSLNNNETRKASVKSQLKYEFEKKEAVLKEQQKKEQVLSKEKNQRQQIIIWFTILGLLLVIIFAGFVFRSLKTTRSQKVIIEVKQKEILDSIHYAKRIQSSLLPSEKYIEKTINRLFKK